MIIAAGASCMGIGQKTMQAVNSCENSRLTSTVNTSSQVTASGKFIIAFAKETEGNKGVHGGSFSDQWIQKMQKWEARGLKINGESPLDKKWLNAFTDCTMVSWFDSRSFSEKAASLMFLL
ncbi:MAG: hypothetical protein C5B47_00760 [Verrucomicrobia bacterium]|nr:MAG: hypothetical protein C5B47_00760 [Verrucomicrobiota bacterium]